MGHQVDELISLLQDSLAETVRVLSALSDAELDEPSEHPCAMGGTIHDLLAHNIDHERMHTGQVYTARYNLKRMQKSRVDRLVTETLRARAGLIASLIGLPDEALDAPPQEEQWTIRQMIEHTVYWERHSIDDLARTQLRGRVSPGGKGKAREVRDPVSGLLPQAEW
jgi:uncharacterized damage-inducible protein DinB